MSTTRRGLAGLMLAMGFMASIAACSESGQSPEDGSDGRVDAGAVDPDAEVTITVGGMPAPNKEAQLEQFNQLIADFEDLHPNVTVVGEEYRWDPQTWNARVAGGTLPTTVSVPFTNVQALIELGQVANLTSFVESDELLSATNPTLSPIAQNEDGDTFGVVVGAYAMALIYNRSVYEAAGLDPDDPPTTWEEIRSNAQQITEQTDLPGFVLPTTNNTGGWLVTTMAYSNGSLVESVDGESVTATLTEPGVVEALEFVQQARWEDDTFGDNYLMSNGDVRQAMAAGEIGQTINGGDLYMPLVRSLGMDPQDVGIAPLPTDGLGVLGGGNVAVFSPTATPNEIHAALEWIKFRFLSIYENEGMAIADAEAAQAEDRPVGMIRIPIFDQETEDRYLNWIEPYVNVPRENFAAYEASMLEVEIQPEPPVQGQLLYSTLDAALQGALTSEDSDVTELLERAQEQFRAQLEAA